MQYFWDTCKRIIKDHSHGLSKYYYRRLDIRNSTARTGSPRRTGFSRAEPVQPSFFEEEKNKNNKKSVFLELLSKK